ncbi:uncharacterized protein BT62DRAFT_1071433 [Guyanagaster necrorhizus]|uniref:Uncharacterized protein n=1 Tax=Guyanagaster necrorhizus TaxID=856835 RepID=A0A9P7W4H6_9AGAR|nr:uncharacterized protein BT62DRAFT_1071433 [Guyanagaster necrorhizus MCA 3950]KAG7452275.1 hypothetical protein BT62DRAFT_1071433 [Guyanagaster necrorhizus MCA 3950]
MLGWRPSAGPALRCLKTQCIRLTSTEAAPNAVPDLSTRLLDRIGGGRQKRIVEDLDGIKIPSSTEIQMYSGPLSGRLMKIHAQKPAAPPATVDVPSNDAVTPPPASLASSASSSPSETPSAPTSLPGERFKDHYKSVDLDTLAGTSTTAVHIPTPQETARVNTHKKYVAGVNFDALFEQQQTSQYRRNKEPRQQKKDGSGQEKDEKQLSKTNARPVRAQRGNAPSRNSRPQRNNKPRRPRTDPGRRQNNGLEIVLSGDAEIDTHVKRVLESEEKAIPDREANVSFSYLPQLRGPAVDFALPQAEVLIGERKGPGMEDETKSVARPQVQLGSLFGRSHHRLKSNYKYRLPDDKVWATPVTQLPTVTHAQMVSGRQNTIRLDGQKELLEVVKSL